MDFTISNNALFPLNGLYREEFPRYTTQLMNLANQNGGGTRPAMVGQMSNLVPQYLAEADTPSPEGWEAWYQERYPHALQDAADRVEQHIAHLRDALAQIDRPMVERYLHELLIQKTYVGLVVQPAILSALAQREGCSYRLATPEEESQGIDGYVGETAYSIKPTSYRSMARLPESISARMVYYDKTKTGLSVHVEDT